MANDTTDAPAVGPLSAVGGDFSAVGNSSYGYINGDSKSRVDRIDYSIDSATTLVKGNLNQTRIYSGATGNQFYGYFGGGGSSRSSIDRVDYSNDINGATPKVMLILDIGVVQDQVQVQQLIVLIIQMTQ